MPLSASLNDPKIEWDTRVRCNMLIKAKTRIRVKLEGPQRLSLRALCSRTRGVRTDGFIRATSQFCG